MEPRIIQRGRGPEIEGTRITVYDVWDYQRLGWHHTEIAAVFRISSHQVKAAMEYIAEHRDEVLANYQRILERHRNHNYSPETQEKLAQCRAQFQARLAAIQVALPNEDAHAGSHGR